MRQSLIAHGLSFPYKKNIHTTSKAFRNLELLQIDLCRLNTGNSGMGLNNYNRGLSSWLMSSLGGFGGSEAGDAGDIIEQQQANQRRFNSFGGGGSFGNFWGGRGSGGYRGFNSPYFLNPYGDY